MVEKKGAVDNLEEVLSVPGVDMIQWGGSDYSMSVGKAGQRGSAELKAVERRVIETSLKMGVPPRAEIGTADEAKYYLDLGVRHFCIGTDISILYNWWKTEGNDLQKAISQA
jgi:4-hydroxy-2-oxoheptanedioate aldolase